MSFPEGMSLVTGLLQFIVAGYTLRLNRIFGTARVGWSLFWAFSLLALLHFIQSVKSFNNGAFMGTETEVIYALIALLLLTGMIHLETLLKERLRLEQEEKRMRDGLELLVNDKTAHLTKAIEDLQLEITERKKAEAQISEQARRLVTEQRLMNSLITGTPDLVYFKDRQGRFIRINEAYVQRYGLSSPSAAVGKTDFDIFGEQHARQAHEDEQRIMTTGLPMVDKEEQEDWKDGRITWVSSTKLPLRDDSGQVVGIMGISRDITVRKQAEASLHSTERALKAISRCNQAMIRATTESALLEEICRVIVEAGGCRLAWVGLVEHDEQKSVRPIAHAGFEEGYLEKLKLTWADTERGRGPTGTAIRTRQPATCRNITTDPSFAPWRDDAVKRGYNSSLSLPLMNEGKVFGALNIYAAAPNAFDDEEVKLLAELADDLAYGIVTLRARIEHQRAEEHIEEQARMLELAPNVIMVRDLEDHIQYWNKSAERIYGWSAAEAIGRKVEELLHKDIFNVSKYQEAKKAVMEKGDWQGEFVTQTKKGQEVNIEARWTLVRDQQGNPKSVLAINTDVTDKKKLEAQFLRSQRMESLGTLAGGIGHDLNNVLTPLLVSIQMMKGKITNADRQKLLNALEANVQRGAGLVKQVLAFGRGVEGERAMVQPKHIGRGIKQVIQETFPKSVEFELHTAPGLWSIIGDPTQLHQVLLNLCVNARDAMPVGGKLSIRMENVTFDETYVGMNLEARVGPYVVIQVTDTGTGIPRQIQERIYDPFFTTKGQGKGTGLGLSTSLAIVKSHGGFIQCHSVLGQGTTFKVYLPASLMPAAAEKVAAEPAKLPRGHNELVLIVDDEEPILKVAQKTLERFGYRVLLAADGAEAVSLFRSRPQEIAVVITDVAMPHLDGPATISALKAIKPNVKIIGSSGLSSDGGRARVKDAGIQYFLPKPYTAESVLHALHEVLRKNPAK